MGMLIFFFTLEVKQEEGNYYLMWLDILNIAVPESIFVKKKYT